MDAARTILITGASRGIGAYLARGLAREGRTLLLAARTREALYDTARACTSRGAQVVTFAVELAEPDSISRLLDEVRNYPIDLLINNAGIMADEALPWDNDPDAWWLTQEVNVRAPYLLSRTLVPAMLQRGGGRIIDLSSGAAVRDHDLSSAYFVSKTALLRLAGCLHEAGYDQGLRMFSVAPGVVATDMTIGTIMHEGRTDWTDPADVTAIVCAIADGELDGLAGTQVRAGQDSLDELRQRSAASVSDNARRLRLTGWE